MVVFFLSSVRFQVREQANQGIWVFLLPSNTFGFILGDHEVFPDQMWYIIPTADFGSCWKTSKGCILEESWSDVYTISVGYLPYLHSQAQPPNVGNSCRLPLYTISFFPKLTAIGVGWNAEWLVNQVLCLPAQLSLYHIRLVRWHDERGNNHSAGDGFRHLML